MFPTFTVTPKTFAVASVCLVGRFIQLSELLFRSGAKKQILVHRASRTKDRDEKDKTDSPHEAEGTAIFAPC